MQRKLRRLWEGPAKDQKEYQPVKWTFPQNIAGPDCLDVRTNQVFSVVRCWSGNAAGLGAMSETRTEITPRPRVIEKDLGRRLLVGPVSQSVADSVINPAEAANTEVLIELVGPNAGYYKLHDYSAAGPFAQKLILTRLERRHPQPEG